MGRERMKVDIEVQGKVATVRSNIGYRPKGSGGTRGDVTGFSAASRKRLLVMLASLDFTQKDGSRTVAVFITLTTRAILPAREAKQRLQTFCKRITRKYPNVSGVWRMEFQDRGAPHFHLILFNLPYWPKEEVQRHWGQIVAQDKPFTRIEAIRSWRGVMYYASKYVGKRSADCSGFNNVTYLTEGESIGRVWGVFNRCCLPFAEKFSITVPFGSWFFKMKELAFSYWEGIDLDSISGFTLFLDDPGVFMGRALAMVPSIEG